jgi:type III secretion system FlhB-like substrate exporter
MEGNPQIKGRIAQKQRQMSRMRMVQAVKDADVVITNPTHYAVALAYKEGKNTAPVILAKGKDYLAQKIKEKAKEENVEIVENKPLAQALYFFCEVGDEVPEDMYKAVMENLSEADYIIKAAAPADYTVEKPYGGKIKSENLTLNLRKTVDIAKEAGKVKGGKKLIIFSAETEALIENAKGKLSKKNADMVVANDVTKEGAGFNKDTNIVTLILKDGTVKPYEMMLKSEVAEIILDQAAKL